MQERSDEDETIGDYIWNLPPMDTSPLFTLCDMFCLDDSDNDDLLSFL